jgi:hypothetical protein
VRKHDPYSDFNGMSESQANEAGPVIFRPGRTSSQLCKSVIQETTLA